MSTRYVRADEPDGPVYYVGVVRPLGGAESWTLIRDDSQNGGSVAPTEITREQWQRELIEGVFVPSPLKSKVSQRARDETTKCPHGLACLTTGQCGDHPPCEAQSTAGQGNLVLKSRERRACPYRLPSGHDNLCQCPVRFEMYQRFGR